ncbi:hypothetical protein BDQ12DRAFT_734965 [Crucibulum laeve]|uniref:BTB domain-containing protein n=1 Tax=Crucibulum laeve TaxID=68775 RepID=A0A5C3M5J8_9AGAR|nr:hypothetical protein BDQ12DRAFT_734965 [Crucibulum laeve]
MAAIEGIDVDTDATELCISETFNAPDADIVFQSSDSHQFYVHGKNLEVTCGGFDAEEIVARGEVSLLPEAANILSLLFQYIYPNRHPSLKNENFEVIAPLAYAAEKYKVFAAMNICHIRMLSFLSTHPLDVMKYGAHHGYPEIVDAAAPLVIGTATLAEVAQSLPSQMMMAWIQYYQAWLDIVPLALNYQVDELDDCTTIASSKGKKGKSYLSAKVCAYCGPQVMSIRKNLSKGVASLARLSFVFEHVVKPEMCWCPEYFSAQWRSFIEAEINRIPKFNTFL